jgi:tRNA(Ile)-lysidine synthase
MKNIESHFAEVLAQYKHLAEKPMLAAVSGGIDSLVLLHLLISNGCSVEIMHCNFGLRGEESDLDEKFVHGLSEQYQIPLHIRKFDTAAHASSSGISVQMAARELRLSYMDELMKTGRFSCVCLAHHLNDNIETFFLNLLRGTGMKGLKGMSVLSGNIFRPLLNISRSMIADYAKMNNLTFREDSSNEKDDYVRNRVRKHILPVITEHFPQFLSSMQQNFHHFASGVELLDVLCDEAVEGSVTQAGNIIKIDLKTILQNRDDSLLLYHVIEKYGFSHHQAELIWSNAGNTETTVYDSQTHRAFLKGNVLEIIHQVFHESCSFRIDTPEDFSNPNLPVRMGIEWIDYSSDADLKVSSEQALLDANLVPFPLIIRKWKKGDVFYPYGMRGKKLISDFFSDRKMTAVEKQNTWILCCGEEVVWLIGQRIDNRWRVRPSTEIILSLKVEFL